MPLRGLERRIAALEAIAGQQQQRDKSGLTRTVAEEIDPKAFEDPATSPWLAEARWRKRRDQALAKARRIIAWVRKSDATSAQRGTISDAA